jgi:hypothetical protein
MNLHKINVLHGTRVLARSLQSGPGSARRVAEGDFEAHGS